MEYCRNCPDCDVKLTYAHSKSYQQANEKQTKCIPCCHKNTQVKKYDYDSHYDTELGKYFYVCHICHERSYLSDKRGLRRALTDNHACQKCKWNDPSNRFRDPDVVEKREKNYKRFIELNTGINSPARKPENRKKSSDRIKAMLADPTSKMSIAQAKQRAGAHAEDSCQRKCPECGDTIYHKSGASRLNADRNNSKCKKCRLSQKLMKYDQYIDKETGKLFKLCHKCDDKIYFTTTGSLIQSLKCNSVCQACQGKDRQKQGYDHFFNIVSGMWEKPCSNCKDILSYSNKKGLMRAVNGNFECQKCSANRRTIDRTTSPAYMVDQGVWIRGCPQCNSVINYASYHAYSAAEKANYKCASCAMKEVSNRPEIRMKSSRTMIKILHTACSKKELELYELIKHLGFIHNDKSNLINICGYFPDMVHSDYKLVVEFYGDKYHANLRNKRFGDDNSIIKIGSETKTAKQIRDRDAKRQKVLEDAGYRVVIIWEDVFDKPKYRQAIVEKIEDIVKQYVQLLQ